jgi:hypothetical protein
MGPRLLRLAPPGAFALLATVLIAWDGMLTVAFTDYEREAEPSFLALRAGHLGAFLAHLPAYGGSLILRAPFALLPSLWHGGTLAVFRTAAVPCLLAAIALGLMLFNHLDRRGRAGAGWLALALCVANPITLRALEIGHPEDLLGATLCVAAVIAAVRDRPGLAGLLLGLALANKAWAVLAIPPVALALRSGRVRAAAGAIAVPALVLAPMLLRGSSGVGTAGRIAAASNAGFTPEQVWWFLGSPGRVVGVQGVMPGYRLPPGWLVPIGHLLVVAAAFGVCAAWWWLRGRRERGPQRDPGSAPSNSRYEPLLLLAFVMLVRCALDPWDIIYYTLPFLIALTAWETLARGRSPLGALTVTVGLWVSWGLVGSGTSPDLRSIAFLLWSLPVLVVLGWRLYAPESFTRAVNPLLRKVGLRLPSLARIAVADGPRGSV